MAAEFPLALVIKAVDKASGPLRAMAAKLNAIREPFKAFSKDWEGFSKAAGLANIVNGFKGVGSAVGDVGRETFALGGKILAMAGVAGLALWTIVHGAVEAGDKLAEMAQRTGTSVDFYASLGHAAAQADVDQEQFNGSMDKFNKNLGEAKAGGGPLLEFLKKVSPVLAEQIKHVKSTEEGLSLMTDAFKRLPDTQRRAALSGAAFGKSNLQMGEFLHQGSAAIQQQQAEYLRLAGSQEDFAKGASDLDNAMRETEVAFLGLRSAAFGALFPAFTKLSKVVTEFVVKNREGIKKWAEGAAAAISAWVEGGGIERLIAAIGDFGKTIGKVIDFLGGFKGVAIVVGAIMAGPLLVSILGLIPALAELAIALVPLAVALLPFVIAALPFIAIAAIVVGVCYAIHLAAEPLSALFSSAAKATGAWWEILAGIATLDFDRVVRGWTQGVEAFRTAIASAFTLLGFIPGGNMLQTLVQSSGLLDAAMTFGNDVPGTKLGAGGARPVTNQTEARVSVDFNNLPPGARVTTDRNSSQPVDVSAGYSMVAP